MKSQSCRAYKTDSFINQCFYQSKFTKKKNITCKKINYVLRLFKQNSYMKNGLIELYLKHFEIKYAFI